MDIPIPAQLLVAFGCNATTRLGSISPIKKIKGGILGRRHIGTKITITGFFRNEIIPEYVVDAVLAHEICHYAHGFFSEMPKKHRLPHRGGVVEKELAERGLGETLARQKRWIKNNWQEFIKKSNIKSRKRRVKRRRILIFGV